MKVRQLLQFPRKKSGVEIAGNNSCSDADLDDYIKKSTTQGLIKNDGTIDSTIYAPASYCDYSTTEHVVGTWVDGNTLYEKTISNEQLTTGFNYFNLTENIDNLIYCEGHAFNASINLWVPLNMTNLTQYSRLYYQKSVNRLVLESAFDLAGYVGTITIRYTKA